MSRSAILLVLLGCVSSVGAQPANDNPSAEAAGPTPEMQTHMRGMREQMDRMHATSDPAERQRLMREHMAAMHEAMQMMSRMMEQDSGEREMPACTEGDVQCRMRHVEMQQRDMSRNMQMMHMMMSHMMEQMEAEQGPSESADREHH